MSAFPVDAPTVRAASECLLSMPHVGRNQARGKPTGQIGQLTIALGAAREGRGPLYTEATAQGFTDLCDLFFQRLRSDQEGLHTAAPRQFMIAGNDQPSLGPRPCRQLRIAAIPPLDGIIPQQPQPARQPAQHGVYQQARNGLFCCGVLLW